MTKKELMESLEHAGDEDQIIVVYDGDTQEVEEGDVLDITEVGGYFHLVDAYGIKAKRRN